MRILLVIPSRSYGNMPGYTKFPDEMLSIGGMLESRGHQVKLVDCNLDKRRPADFLEFAPELIGFCVATGPNIADALSQSTEFKKMLPGVKTVWGFRHASAYPAEVLAEPCVDFAVIGAGEFTIAELADYLQQWQRRAFFDQRLGLQDVQSARRSSMKPGRSCRTSTACRTRPGI